MSEVVFSPLSLRTILTRSGLKPALRTSLMACCVGLVFCSPVLDVRLFPAIHRQRYVPEITGTKETCIWTKLSFPARRRSCLRASTKGADSISPAVFQSCVRKPSSSALFTCHTAQLDNARIRLLVCVVNGNLGDSFDPVLDCVCDVRHDYGYQNTAHHRPLYRIHLEPSCPNMNPCAPPR